MGIRFACHQCGKRLNIKSELGGRRGVCPACSARFRIPLSDTEKSLPVEQKPDAISGPSSTDSPTSPPSSGRSAEATGSPATAASPIDEPVARQAPSSVTIEPAEESRFPNEQRGGDAPTSEQPFEGGPFEMEPTDNRPEPTGVLSEHEPEAIWYVRPPTGNQHGPASTELMRQWIEEGRVAATSLLWRDGWPQWRTAAEALPELADRLPGGGRGVDASSDAFGETVATQPRLGEGGTQPTESAVDLAGQANVGAERRVRSSRRVMWIGVLSAVALMLVGLLVVVANRG